MRFLRGLKIVYNNNFFNINNFCNVTCILLLFYFIFSLQITLFLKKLYYFVTIFCNNWVILYLKCRCDNQIDFFFLIFKPEPNQILLKSFNFSSFIYKNISSNRQSISYQSKNKFSGPCRSDAGNCRVKKQHYYHGRDNW